MYLLDMMKLNAGDIILTAQVGAVSKAVRLATGCKFSHAILYLGDGSYIHSDAQGVHANNIQRLLFEKEVHVIVLRVLESSHVEKAIEFARSQIGVSYSVKEAINTKSPLSKKAIKNRQFCSRLVAQSYEYSGLVLVDDVDYCTPKQLQESKSTGEVLNCVSKATNDQITFAKSHNPLQRQTEITNSILSLVRELTKEDIQSLGDVDQFVIDNPSYDIAITNVVRGSGYLSMFNYELAQNPWRYDGKKFLLLDIKPSYKIERARFELQSANEQVRLYSRNYQMCQCMPFPLKYFEMKMELYRELINRMNRRIDAAKYVLKNI
jgi:hypothetical protein